MQIQKEEIRERILHAARDEFYEKGYEGSNIRAIATIADITPGNIYRYFRNKEEILNAILDPFFVSLQTRFKENEDIPISSFSPKELSDYLLYVLEEYPKEIKLLLDNQGINHIRDFFIQHMYKRMIQDMGCEEILARVLARNLVESTFAILDECKGDKLQTHRLLMKLFSLAFVESVQTNLYR